MNHKIALITSALLIAFASQASAAIVATYWAADGINSNPLQPHDYDDNVTASAASGHGSVSLDPRFSSYGYSTTLDERNYVGFTIKPDAGYEITLSSLDFKTFGSPSPISNEIAATSYHWAYRINDGAGFGSWISGKTYTSADPDFNNNFAQKNWDFADFTTTGTVEFGLFAAGTAGDITIVNATYDKLNVNGTVQQIPEASAVLLGAVGSLALLRRRR